MCMRTTFGASKVCSWQSDEFPLRSVSRIVSVAQNLLQVDGRHFILKVDREKPGREIVRWRFVSLALPPEILISAASSTGERAPAERVRILHPTFAPDQPVAHQHVHHAAVMSFEDLWVTLRRRALLSPDDLLTSLRETRAFCPGLHPRHLPRGKERGGSDTWSAASCCSCPAYGGMGWYSASSFRRR